MIVGVVGLGYVGLPLVVAFAEAGAEVIAVDVDRTKVAAIRRGSSYVEDIASERLTAALPHITATTSYGPLADAEAILVCVPTPLTRNREPDLTPLRQAADQLAKHVRPGQLIVLESTTYPGTTRDLLVPTLERISGLRVPEQLNVAFSPERVDPGRTDYQLRNTPKVVGGLTARCTERARALYALVCDSTVEVSTPEAAELTKLLENIFRSVNIALVNELAILAERMGIDIWEVLDAAATKPYGFMPFQPGPGMGGHCLPVDPFYLTWRAREFHTPTEFIELAGKINQQMPAYCVERIERALNDQAKPLRGSKLAILGVAYKGGVADIRESPAIRIIEQLTARGAQLAYHDPFVPELAQLGLASVPLEAALADADAVVLVTAHPGIDHVALADRTPLFVDLRGVTRGASSANIVRL
ncbi:MAG TPA: nucleotide sugar dehydrogenase [Solirubrobacteraceae bacterium]|nr:nucleotide sugar dehydrogenase [Solirubrobacteraceae bacterium]